MQEARGGGVQREIYAIPNVVPSLPDESSAIAGATSLSAGSPRLTPEQRAVTVMHFYVGLSLAEISETLGVLLGTIGSRLHYAKRALRAALEADERGEEGADGMTGRDSDRQIDQIIADWLESEPYTTPDAPVEAAIAFAYDHPRRPSLAGTRRDVMCRPLWLSLRPVVVLAALVGLLALTIGGVALLGARPAPTPEPSNEPGADSCTRSCKAMRSMQPCWAHGCPRTNTWAPDVAFHPASSERADRPIRTRTA